MEASTQDSGPRLDVDAALKRSRASRLRRRIAGYEQQVQQLEASVRQDTDTIRARKGDVDDDVIAVLRRRNDSRHLIVRREMDLIDMRAALALMEVSHAAA